MPSTSVAAPARSATAATDGDSGPTVDVASLAGALPRDLTDPRWHAARSDGELHWVLRNGSPGTGMPPAVPALLSETEAWQVVHYVRALGRGAQP